MQADDIIEPERRRDKDEWGFCSAKGNGFYRRTFNRAKLTMVM